MSRRLLVLVCFLPCLQQSSDVSGKHCRKGQYYELGKHGQVLCVPCPDKTFMDKDHHNEKACIHCKIAESSLNEVEVKTCTSDSNTVIQCVDTHFMDHNDQCKRCKDCSYDVRRPVMARPCERDHDTVCCEPGKRAEWDDSDKHFNCAADTVITTPSTDTSETCEGSVYRENGCTAGEYLLADCSSSDHRVACKSCGDGTFMNLTLHNQTSCTPCSPPPAVGLLVQFVCNRTKDSAYSGLDRPHDTSSCLFWQIGLIVMALILIFSLAINVFLICTRRQGTQTQGDNSSEENVPMATGELDINVKDGNSLMKV